MSERHIPRPLLCALAGALFAAACGNGGGGTMADIQLSDVFRPDVPMFDVPVTADTRVDVPVTPDVRNDTGGVDQGGVDQGGGDQGGGDQGGGDTATDAPADTASDMAPDVTPDTAPDAPSPDLGGDDTAIQDIADGTIPLKTAGVTIQNVFVTARHTSSSNNVTLFVQVHDAQTTDSYTYPEYAGVVVFVNNQVAGNFPDLPAIQPGDCISATGTIGEFGNNIQLEFITALVRNPSPASCGTAPSPLVVPSMVTDFNGIATDLDPSSSAFQPGANAVKFRSVLMQVVDLEVVETLSATYDVTPQNATAGPQLRISNFFFSAATPLPGRVVGTQFSSITGVYVQSDNRFELRPRAASDLVE